MVVLTYKINVYFESYDLDVCIVVCDIYGLFYVCACFAFILWSEHLIHSAHRYRSVIVAEPTYYIFMKFILYDDVFAIIQWVLHRLLHMTAQFPFIIICICLCLTASEWVCVVWFEEMVWWNAVPRTSRQRGIHACTNARTHTPLDTRQHHRQKVLNALLSPARAKGIVCYNFCT